METEDTQEKTATLVLGGRGKTGRRVAERLRGRGVPARVGSRSAEPPFDWEDETTWAPALKGVGAAYASYYPDVAVAALTKDGHAGEIYELTGPRLLTFGEAVAEISRAAGREIRYVSVSVEEFESALAEEDVPSEFVSFLTYLFAEVLDGRNAYLTDGVRRALGRDPRDFADYARETASTGVWDSKR